MPSSKPARASNRKRLMNAPQRARGKTFVTQARRLLAADDLDGAELAVKQAVVALDKAAKSGAIHPNNAARRKSRIMRQLHQAKSA